MKLATRHTSLVTVLLLVTGHWSLVTSAMAQADIRVDANGNVLNSKPTNFSTTGHKLKVDGVEVIGGGGNPPTGTGFRHVTAGAEDSAAKTVVDVDVASNAAIAQTKLNFNGLIPPGWLGTSSTTATAGNDSRLSDQRTPLDGTVTDAKVASGAAIAESKIANLVSDLNAKISSVPISRTVFVDVNGNNTNAAAGDLSKPALTITRAITLASGLTPTAANPVVIDVGPGTFTENTGVSLPNYVSLIGAGRTATTIQSSLSSAGNCAAIVNPGNYSVIGYLKIQATGIGSGLFAFPIGAGSPGTAFTGVILRGLTLVGDTDAVYVHATVTNSDLVAYDCILQSKWDSVYIPPGSSADFYDCQSLVVGQAAESTAAPAHGLNDAGGSVRWFGGVIQAQGSTASGIANIALNATSSSTLEVYNAKIIRPAATASWDFQAISPATIVYAGLVRSDGAALTVSSFNSGTLSEASRYAVRDNNLSDLTNSGTARTNLGVAIGSNVQAYDADLDALAALSGTHTIYYRSAANTWSAVTIGTGLDFTGATLSATGGGASVDDTAFASSWNGVTGTAPSKNAVYDWAHSIDPNDNGRIASVELSDFDTTAPTSSGKIPIWDNSASKYVPGDPLVQGLTAHDAVGTSTNPVAVGGFASAAAPTDVSADGDIVRAWYLRNGSGVMNLAAGGNLIGATSNALDINIKSGNPTSMTANAGTNLNTSALALDATLTGGTTKAIARGGAKGATTAADITSTANGADHQGLDVQVQNSSLSVTGTFWQATQPVSGTFWQATQPVSIADGSNTTFGAKADAKSTATDTTAVSAMSVLKEISAMEQAPASRAVTNAGTFGVQMQDTSGNGITSNSTTYTAKKGLDINLLGTLGTAFSAAGKIDEKIADGDNATLGAKADGKSTATDTTAVSAMAVLKEISAMAQSPAALPSNQSVNVSQINGVTPLMGAGNTGTGSPRVTIASDQAEVASKVAAGSNVTEGNTTDTAAADANGTINAHAREVAKDTASIVANGVKVTNGTQAADTIAGDSGQNVLLTAGNRKEVSFTTSTVQAVASTDVSNYRWATVQITTQGGSSTVTFQNSNDNSNWYTNSQFMNINGGNSTGLSGSTTSTNIFAGPMLGRYFRLNVTGIASGTTAGVIEFSSTAPTLYTTNTGSVSQAGNWTSRTVGNGGAILDGVITAATAPANGIPALAVYNSTEVAPTTGQSTALQIDSKGRLKDTIRDAGGNDRGVNVNASNQLSTSLDNVAYNTGTRSATTQRVTVATDDVVPASQSGTWTMQPGNTANTTPWLFQIRDGAGNARGANVDANNNLGVVLPAETTKVLGTVRNVGNAGANFDSATNAAPPANAILDEAISATALPTAVTATNTVAKMADKFGRQVMLTQAPRDLIGTAAVQTTTTSQTALIAAQGAGVFADITSLTITTETGTANIVSLSDGTTTYKFSIPATAGGGVTVPFNPPLPATSSNTAWNVTSSATVTTDFVAVYVKNK